MLLDRLDDTYQAFLAQDDKNEASAKKYFHEWQSFKESFRNATAEIEIVDPIKNDVVEKHVFTPYEHPPSSKPLREIKLLKEKDKEAIVDLFFVSSYCNMSGMMLFTSRSKVTGTLMQSKVNDCYISYDKSYGIKSHMRSLYGDEENNEDDIKFLATNYRFRLLAYFVKYVEENLPDWASQMSTQFSVSVKGERLSKIFGKNFYASTEFSLELVRKWYSIFGCDNVLLQNDSVSHDELNNLVISLITDMASNRLITNGDVQEFANKYNINVQFDNEQDVCINRGLLHLIMNHLCPLRVGFIEGNHQAHSAFAALEGKHDEYFIPNGIFFCA